jgi:hypothetical protein
MSTLAKDLRPTSDYLSKGKSNAAGLTPHVSIVNRVKVLQDAMSINLPIARSLAGPRGDPSYPRSELSNLKVTVTHVWYETNTKLSTLHIYINIKSETTTILII